VKADYFGHPLLDGVRAERPRPEVLAALGLATADRYVVLLPGSRPAEVAHHRPLFASVAAGLTAARPGLSCVMADYDAKLPMSRFDIMAQAECAIAVSGTVTAELAILGVPMVVTYHMPAVELLLARLLVKLRWFSLPNILTGREVVPECLNASAAELVGRTLELLQDGPARRTMSAGLADVRTRLLPAGAMARIAQLVAQMARSDMTQAA
jgi:lipid-A-disaccharide synthase